MTWTQWILHHWYLTPPATLIIVALGVTTFWRALARWAVRRNGRLARQGWAPHDGPLDGLDEGELVDVAGKLTISKGALSHPRDGTPAAVLDIVTSESRFWFAGTAAAKRIQAQAEQLSLERDGATVELEGPITLQVGTRQWFPGRLLRKLPRQCWRRLPSEVLPKGGWGDLGARWGVFRAVVPGDEVMVRGVVRRVGDERRQSGRGYRQAAVRWKLTPAASAGQLDMQSLGPPRFAASLWHMLRAPQVWVLSMLAFCCFAAAAPYASRVVECEASEQCRDEGRCGTHMNTIFELTVYCAAESREGCLRSTICRKEARPSAVCAPSAPSETTTGTLPSPSSRVPRTNGPSPRGKCWPSSSPAGLASMRPARASS